MHIVYYDEAGDDGFPRYSSPLFVMSTCYLHHLQWRECYQALHDLRGSIKREYGIPIRQELHWRYFLLNKKPYVGFWISDNDRLEVVKLACEVISGLNVRFINVCIVKPRLNVDMGILDTAFKFSIQRIENDLDPRRNPENTFMIITDAGRVGKMRRTSRRIQRVNYIPSRFGADAYRREIRSLVEDPLPKDSKESHFIQICDLVASLIYYHRLLATECGELPNRMPAELDRSFLEGCLEQLMPSLNSEAARDDRWGIKEYPK